MAKPGTASHDPDIFGLYKKVQMALIDQLAPPHEFGRDILKKILANQAGLRRGLTPLTEGRFDGLTAQVEPNLRFDKRKEGWDLLEHAPRRITAVSDIEPVSFLRPGESSVKGYDLVGRARYELCVDLGQEDAEFLLEHKKMPKKFLERDYLFTGTIWRREKSLLGFPCLRWNYLEYSLCWLYLGYDYDAGYRLLRSRK